jgi:hypothetical protein
LHWTLVLSEPAGPANLTRRVRSGGDVDGRGTARRWGHGIASAAQTVNVESHREIRQERADLRKMKQIITGVENPGRRLWRRARRELLAETEELDNRPASCGRARTGA